LSENQFFEIKTVPNSTTENQEFSLIVFIKNKFTNSIRDILAKKIMCPLSKEKAKEILMKKNHPRKIET
jgi:hypothetical protein